MASAPIRNLGPSTQFVIGKDVTAKEIATLTRELTNWFRSEGSDRQTEDPETLAKDIITQCLNATTKAGDPWYGAPKTLAARIKTKAAYDMTTGVGVKMPQVKNPKASRKLSRGADQNAAKIREQPTVAQQSFDVEAFRTRQEAELLEAHPELVTPALLPHVRRLTLLYAQQELMDRELLTNTSASKRDDTLRLMEVLNKTLESVLKILDIHPESLRKKIKEQADGTLGDLVSTLAQDEQFRILEPLWADQLALLLWAASVRPNGRGDGRQLTEWEVWHMTRTLPISFTCQCGKRHDNLVRGFTPKMLKAHLIAQGILMEKSPFPQLLTDAEAADLSASIDAMPDDRTLDDSA